MPVSRDLEPQERIIDALDRAFALNVVTIVSVRGPLDENDVEAAIRAVERRHPILRARLDRARGLRFISGEAPPIPFRHLDARKEDIDTLAAEALSRQGFADDGPRGSLTLLRHALGHSTLMLSLHHVVADAVSGVIVARDILRAIAGTLPSGEVYSPGRTASMEKVPSRPRALAGALFGLARSRLGRAARVAATPMRLPVIHLHTIELDDEHTERLLACARHAGTTLHGVIVEAIGDAIPEPRGPKRTVRALHSLDMRGIARGKAEAVGYYGSYTETPLTSSTGAEHEVSRAVTAAVHRAKQAERDVISEPLAGRLATVLGASFGGRRLRRLIDRAVFASTFGITNRGRLESYGLEEEIGALHVTRASLVASACVERMLFVSASTFGGALTIRVSALDPQVASHVGERVRAKLVRIADTARAERSTNAPRATR